MNTLHIKTHMKTLMWFSVAMTLVTLALAIVYAYYLVPPLWDKSFGILDDRFYFGPNAFLLDASLQQGEYPLWNPLAYCGMPFAADPQANVCYPPHILRSLLTPAFNPYATATGMQIMRALHLLWAGLGMLLLARAYGVGMLASVVAAMIFLFNDYSIVHFTEFYVFPLVMAWAPWTLWAALRAFRATTPAERLRYWGLCVLFFALAALGGFPQLSLYMGVTLGAFVLLDGLFHFRWRPMAGGPRRMGRLVMTRLFFLAGVAVFAGLAASALLFPAFEFAGHSARAGGAGVQMAPWPQDLSWPHLLKCLVAYPGNTWLPQGCRAAGIGSLLALLAALLGTRRRDALVFFGVYLVLTDCTLGPPFPVGAALSRFDFLNITISPWRAGCFSSLALGMAVALGVETAGRAPAKWWLGVLHALLMLLVGAALLYVLYHWLHERTLHNAWYGVFHAPVLTVAALTLFSLWRAPRFGPACIALLLMLEILVWSGQMLPLYVAPRVAHTLDTRGFGEHTALSTSNRRDGNSRPNWHMFRLEPSFLGYNPLYVGPTREVLCRPGHETFYRILLRNEDAVVENQRGNLLVKRSFWLTRQWAAGPLPDKDAVYPPTTTVFLPDIPTGTELAIPEVAREDVHATAVSDRVERIDLGEGEALRARARMAANGNWQLQLPAVEQGMRHAALYIGYVATGPVDFRNVCQEQGGAYFFLKRSRALPSRGQERFLEIPLPDCERNIITLRWPRATADRVEITRAWVSIDNSDEDALISIDERTANTVSLTVGDLPEARFLVFLDSYYPGWRAWVNGEEVEIIKVNDAFKGISLPPGTHQVHFAYDSIFAWIGQRISLAVFVVLFALVFILPFVIARRSASEASNHGEGRT